jgi:DNA polymerase-3 subunit epsilon
MKPTVKYWAFLCAIALAIFGAIAITFEMSWLSLDETDHQLVQGLANKLIPFPFIGGLIIFLVTGGMVSLLFKHYIIPILQLAEETRLITAVNEKHRIEPCGATEVRQLIGIINESANAYEALLTSVDRKITTVHSALVAERERLSALMSELPNGVIVCDIDNQVLLYNQQAKRLLSDSDQGSGVGAHLGLGRSIFGLLEKNPIQHGLDVLQQRIESGLDQPTTGFMMVAGKSYLRVTMAPVIEHGIDSERIISYVLTLEDIAPQIDADNRREVWLQGLINGLHEQLGDIRENITQIIDNPGQSTTDVDMRRQRIRTATAAIESRLEQAREESSRHIRSATHHEQVQGADLLSILTQHLARRYGIRTTTCLETDCWLRLDTYITIQGLAFLAGRLNKRGGVKYLRMSVHLVDDHPTISIHWPLDAVPLADIVDWQMTPLVTDRFRHTFTFADFIASSDGTLTLLPVGGVGCDGISIRFPENSAPPAPENVNDYGPRPLFYEFNLFSSALYEKMADIPLRHLTFVAFDTETTGLNPSDGDEIIQIGAIRAVNGRLLHDEILDQLIDPQRYLPAIATQITGITPEMLVGQPTIDKILPGFYKFAEGAALVAHNAAFDMRFLQLQEDKTGIRFDNPVLDTLLLSSLVHPNQEHHSLDAIAERMNLKIVGRHTGIGDAVVTAEIMLRLIPLLESEGIRTVGEAIKASSTSPFARYTY